MDFRLPEIGEGVYEAELVRWLVEPGDVVKRGQDLAEVMTDKATMPLPSPFAGKISSLAATVGQQVKVGDVVLTYTTSQKAEAATASEEKVPTGPARTAEPIRPSDSRGNGPFSHQAPVRTLPIKAAPSVREMARKLHVDLNAVPGTGPDGRILIEDLSTFLQRRPPHESAESPLTRVPTPLPLDYGKPGTRLKLVGLRRKIAEHMVQAKKVVPHYTYVDECDVTELVKMRDSLRQPFARSGIKLTYLAFFVKAVVAALKEVPLVNSSLHEDQQEIELHDRYHIGIAVATPRGLIVPVVRDADQKDLLAIAREIDRLSTDARNGQSKRDDLSGSTFTVTSVGGIGGLFSTPVINYPEAAILGIGKVVRRPVFVHQGEAEQIRAADIVYLSLSFDHRIIDGAIGAHFTNVLIKQLSNPALLLLPDLS